MNYRLLLLIPLFVLSSCTEDISEVRDDAELIDSLELCMSDLFIQVDTNVFTPRVRDLTGVYSKDIHQDFRRTSINNFDQYIIVIGCTVKLGCNSHFSIVLYDYQNDKLYAAINREDTLRLFGDNNLIPIVLIDEVNKFKIN